MNNLDGLIFEHDYNRIVQLNRFIMIYDMIFCHLPPFV